MPAGRPTAYKKEYAEQARKLCLLGATDAELADFFEVDVSTINRWKLTNEEFCASIKMGKDPVDDRAERRLYERAMGYQHPDTDIRVVNGVIVETPITKYYPPDTTALIFWLKNRRSAEWRDKTEVDHNVVVSEALREARERAEKKS